MTFQISFQLYSKKTVKVLFQLSSYLTKKKCSGLIPAVEGQGGRSTSQSPSTGQPTAFSPKFSSNLVDAFKKTFKTSGDKKNAFFCRKLNNFQMYFVSPSIRIFFVVKWKTFYFQHMKYSYAVFVQISSVFWVVLALAQVWLFQRKK